MEEYHENHLRHLDPENPDDWKGLNDYPRSASLTSALTGKTVPSISVIRQVLDNLRFELHAALGGAPDGVKGPAPREDVNDERPPLVVKTVKRRKP